MYDERRKRSLFEALIKEFGISSVAMAQEVIKQQITIPVSARSNALGTIIK